jgi:hypothetical protein
MDFSSPAEYQRFLLYIENQVSAGHAEEVSADPDYGYGEIYGGRWFRNIDTAEIWRLVPPDFPFKGLWEPVRI